MEFPFLHLCWTGGCSLMFQLAVLVYHYPIQKHLKHSESLVRPEQLWWFFCQSRGLIIEEFVAGQASSALLIDLSTSFFLKPPRHCQRQNRGAQWGAESRRHASLPSWQTQIHFFLVFFGRSVGDKKPILGIFWVRQVWSMSMQRRWSCWMLKFCEKTSQGGDRHFIAFYSILFSFKR